MLLACSVGCWCVRRREAADEVVTDALREVGVALSHHNAAVAEPLLDLSQRDAAHGGVTCEGVA